MTSSAVRPLRRVVGALALVVLVSTSLLWVSAQSPAGDVAIDPDDIGGVVTGPKGPEAGVWVIAETTSLPTKFARTVVTDDRGRYVLPDLPRGDYQVWVRGYGLVDSPKQPGKPGQQVVIQPIYRLDLGGASKGGGGLVDMRYVRLETVGGVSTGKIYVNWEDSEQGGDYDQDMWATIEWRIDDKKISVTTSAISASTNNPQGFGYAISGTKNGRSREVTTCSAPLGNAIVASRCRR